MFGTLVLAFGKVLWTSPLSYLCVLTTRQLHETKWKPTCFCARASVTLHQLYHSLVVTVSPISRRREPHSSRNTGVRITAGGHLEGCHHSRGRPDLGEPVIKSYHSKSHLVCVLHPSNVRRPSACNSNHPPLMLSDEKSNYNTMWNAACGTISGKDEQLREPKNDFHCLSELEVTCELDTEQLEETLRKNTDWNESRFLS